MPGISPFYLSRLFRHQRGENFVEHLIAVRMKAAERLARETALSIKEIAARTGYPNTTYFCRVVQKQRLHHWRAARKAPPGPALKKHPAPAGQPL